MKRKWLWVIPILFIGFGIWYFFQNRTSSPLLHSKEPLQAIGSKDAFVTLVKDIERIQKKSERRFFDIKGSVEKSTTTNTADIAGGNDFSKTNTQVDGVDEADIIKTDGKYMYQLTGDEFIVSQISPANKMKVVYRETLSQQLKNYESLSFDNAELYVDEKYAILIGNHYGNDKEQYMPYTKARIYELNNRIDIKMVREVTLKGNYQTSRKINNHLYFITNDTPMDISTFHRDTIVPTYQDSLHNKKETPIPWNNIYYLQNSQDLSFLNIASLDISDSSKKLNVQSLFGNADTVYASEKNLYIAKENRKSSPNRFRTMAIDIARTQADDTDILKFSFEKDNVSFVAKGNVKGSLLNQFSMDEYDNHLRVATTLPSSEQNKVNVNQLSVLDTNMKTVGNIKNIAPDETIYSVRFIGNRGYMVTFKRVDPLFVLDLQNPKEPKILGKLKIPGYSDYLHPYDENHIIGIGKEAVESKAGDFTFAQGIKLALFDITDVENPIEKFKYTIGDRGTESEALHNHKALLFSKEKNIFALPINLRTIPKEADNQNGDGYGEFSFQGAYILGIDLEKGFTLKERITHLNKEDMLKTGEFAPFEKQVQRILYSGNALYTVSPSTIMAHNISSFQSVGTLSLEK